MTALKRAGLDLSAWEVAMIGAEPISPELRRRSSDRFAPCGFRAEAFFPVYGLAEATVAVTFPEKLAPTVVDRVERAGLLGCVALVATWFPARRAARVDPVSAIKS